MGSSAPSLLPRIVGRYAVYGEIASGGMATVHYGRLLGAVGFSRTVAIKRLHAQFAKDPEFVSMFLDEARLAARIRHPNVVQTVDVVALGDELLLVMDYVQGESLSRLVKASRTGKQSIPVPVVSAILCETLHGLHAAHEATSEQGEPLGIVHRDVSPQNVLVGADGVSRVLDFGVAKAAGRLQTTREGQVKGKLAYMSEEQLTGRDVDRRTDVYAAGVVLWEALTLQRLFNADNEGATVAAVLGRKVDPPSTIAAGIPKALDAITMQALERDPGKRFQSAREMADALEACVPVASARRVAEWAAGLAGEIFAQRAKAVAQIEGDPSVSRRIELADAGAGRDPARSSPSEPKAEAVLSQVSSVTVASNPLEVAAPRRRPGRFAIVAGGVTVLVLAAGAARVLRTGAAPPPSSAGAAAAAPPSAPAAPVPSVSTAASSEPSASVAPAVPQPVASTPPRRTHALVAPRKPSPATTAKPCTIKSYVDDQGFTHFTKECR